MASVSTYLNFDGQTEAAFEHYQTVFRAEPVGPVVRVGDIPESEGEPRTPAQARRIAHMALAITGGHVLRGTDVPEIRPGSQMGAMLEPDDDVEAARLFEALAAGGQVVVPLEHQFWGAYFGELVDRFGIRWFVNVDHPPR
ncbi:MAG: VOC family protein [Sandaracinus sp.]|nr:VOC family protein [Sandaracinus sp.]